jgi:RNA ligase
MYGLHPEAGPMHEQFPIDLTLDETRSILASRTDMRARSFVDVTVGSMVLIDYKGAWSGAFPPIEGTPEQIRAASVIRECRGLLFDADTGRPLARRVQKFFNVGEREETLVENIDWSRPHRFVEKLDGSMISAMAFEGRLRLAGRSGISDLTRHVEGTAFGDGHRRMSEALVDAGFTPIFEYCSPDMRIVIDHPRTRLVTTRIRSIRDGTYLPFDEMEDVCARHGVEVVVGTEGWRSGESRMETLLRIHAMSGIEGSVITFDDGSMLKIKTKEYGDVNKALFFLREESEVWRAYADGTTDDVVALLPAEARTKVDEHMRLMDEAVSRAVERYASIGGAIAARTNSGREMMEIVQAEKPVPEAEVPYVLAAVKGKDLHGMIRSMIGKNMGSGPRRNALRHMIGLPTWMPLVRFIGDDAAPSANEEADAARRP